MFRDSLQKNCRKLEQKVHRLARKLLNKKEHVFGDLNDELNHYRQSENFDGVSLDDKVRICKNSIERTSYTPGSKDDLQVYLEDALKGENPKDFHYDYFEEMEDEAVPQAIVNMIQKIYFEVAPVEARRNAISSYEYAQKHWKYASEHAESGAALSTALLSLKSAFDYLIDANSGVESEDYRQIGDKFFQSTVKLDKLGKRKEAQLSMRFALDYYQKGEIPIPEDVRDDWTKYSYNETDNLRTDWKTTERDPMKLLTS